MPNLSSLLPTRFFATTAGLTYNYLEFMQDTGAVVSGVRDFGITSGTHTRAITLTNGAVFNPNQNYRAPRTLPGLQFSVFYYYDPKTFLTPSANSRIETVWEQIENIVGAQGDLYAQRGSLNTFSLASTISASAFFEEATTSWSGKKYDYANASGGQLDSLTVQYKFQLLSDWS